MNSPSKRIQFIPVSVRHLPEHGNKSLWGGWTHDNYGSQYQNQIKDLIKDGSIYAIDAPEESNWEYIICRRCRDDEADSSLATLEDLFA